MLDISNLSVVLKEKNKKILSCVSLKIKKGEIHILNGRNGSGKSTLVGTIMGNPNFLVTQGSIIIKNEKYPQSIISEVVNEDSASILRESGNKYDILINNLPPNLRSSLGVFLANQYPVEIPGVSLFEFLRIAFNKRKEEKLGVFKFKKYLEEKSEIIKYPKKLLTRNLNEGFSGGEKKKTEILQMLILEPKYVLLDEIDSGLDKFSVKEVFEGLSLFKKNFPDTAFLIITHYDKANEYLKPDYIHEISSL